MKEVYNYKNRMSNKRQFKSEFKTPFVPIKSKQDTSRQTSLTATHGVTVTRQKNSVSQQFKD